MKNQLLLLFSIFLFLNSFTVYAQQECNPDDFKAILATDFDTLHLRTNLIIRNKKVEDMPYYETFRFSKNRNDVSYFMLYTLTPHTTLKLSVLDYQNNLLVTDSIVTKNYRMYQVDPSFKGEFKVVLYAGNPDNQCALLSEVILENNSKKVEIPPFNAIDKIDYKSQGLDLLKEYKQELNENRDFPLLIEYSYVLTKSAAYYFELEGDKEVKYKLYNLNRNLITLKKSADYPSMEYYTPDQTGIYYIIMYKNKPIDKTTSLSIYKKYN